MKKVQISFRITNISFSIGVPIHSLELDFSSFGSYKERKCLNIHKKNSVRPTSVPTGI